MFFYCDYLYTKTVKMEKIKMDKETLKNLIHEIIYQEKLSTYYIVNSSYFDTHPYDIKSIVKAVKKAGGQNIRTKNASGLPNQPKVVVFDAHEDMVEDISAEVSRALNTEWVHIREKDW